MDGPCKISIDAKMNYKIHHLDESITKIIGEKKIKEKIHDEKGWKVSYAASVGKDINFIGSILVIFPVRGTIVIEHSEMIKDSDLFLASKSMFTMIQAKPGKATSLAKNNDFNQSVSKSLQLIAHKIASKNAESTSTSKSEETEPKEKVGNGERIGPIGEESN